MSEFLRDSSKLRDRVTVPLPKLTRGLLCPPLRAAVGGGLSAWWPLVFRLMEEDGVEVATAACPPVR